MREVKHIPAAPDRPVDGHKGTFGTVIVIGGSATMIGAPAMCAGAAFRSGAGLVKIATPGSILPFAITIEPSATGIALPADAAKAMAAIDKADRDGEAVLAVGPGLGQLRAAGSLLARLLRGRRTIVLDADGLNLLAATKKPRPLPGAGPEAVMTPHPGEFKRLAAALGITRSGTDPEQRPVAAAELARAHRAVVVLKGHRTVVSDGERVFVNTTGNPAMAAAGSGDVLTGLIAALIAQRMKPFDAAVLGAYLHGLAGDLWAAERGRSGMLARELAERLPEAFEARRKKGREQPLSQRV